MHQILTPAEPASAIQIGPIVIKLYPDEARLLREYLINIYINVYQLKGVASNGHLILAEWLDNKFGARSLRIEAGSSKIAKKVEIPLSIARILLTEMTNTAIPMELNMVLGQIHRQLTNRNFLPHD